jgi:hypothetical protein
MDEVGHATELTTLCSVAGMTIPISISALHVTLKYFDRPC